MTSEKQRKDLFRIPSLCHTASFTEKKGQGKEGEVRSIKE